MDIQVGIVTVGQELLTGRVVNTHAAELPRYLLRQGIRVHEQISVPDELLPLASTIRRLLDPFKRTLIFTCGGLGPTGDDLTLEGIGLALDRLLALNPEALEYVRRAYERAGWDPDAEPEATLKMAKLPVGAIPLPNPVGVAPAVVLRDDLWVIIALPGVPGEFQGFLQSGLLLPYLDGFRSFERFEEREYLLREEDERKARGFLRQLFRGLGGGVYYKTAPRGFSGPLRLVVEFWGSKEEVEEKVEKVGKLLSPYLVEPQ